MSKVTDEILALEKGFWTEADDPGFFEEHLADDAITVIEPMGFIQKHQAMAMPAEKPWQDVEMTDVTVRQLTPDCVIVAYHGQGRHEGDEAPYRGSIASTYVRRDGRWQLVLTAHQPWKPD
ncbi:MAG: nuclear transport factor 2 family protein [Chloroflexi bacterium]|nr:nuclear transport factor 2 family protein [Chloroflexota bacterium]